MADADYLMALELQKLFDSEINAADVDAADMVPTGKTFYQKQEKRRRSNDEDDLNTTSNLVHPEWETLDPTPDVQALFQAFDDKFFQGKLRCVTLEWSKRMYSCAGICYTRRSRTGMAITIRLSEPLLKLRSRKDLIETLLHEMIHAYCSVLGIREGNGGHGPNFRKIMTGINKVAGTNITVYHTFHDEVHVYKTHWWRCNGICQNRKPFYGYVKRTSNRAPGPNDIWWRKHLESCGGYFLKVREPEKKQPIKKENKENTVGNDLRKYFPAEKAISGNLSTFKGPVKSNGGGTLLLNPKAGRTTTSNSTITETSTPIKNSKSFGNLKNVVELKDLETEGDQVQSNAKTNAELSLGIGYSLTNLNDDDSDNDGDILIKEDNRRPDRNKVRDIWAKKYFSSTSKTSQSSTQSAAEYIDEDDNITNAKKRRIFETGKVTCDGSEHWKIVDDEIMIKENINTVIAISSDEEDVERDDSSHKKETIPSSQSKVAQSAEERHKLIKQEIIDSSEIYISEDDIELLDDDYDDSIILSASIEIADTSLVDDLFGEDTLLKDFNKENAVYGSSSKYYSNPANDIITCPVCQDKITREQFSDHIDGCVGITIRINPMPSTSKGGKKTLPFRKNQPKTKQNSDNVVKQLKKAGYASDEIQDVLDSGNNSFENDGRKRREGLDTSTHACPVCAQEVDVNKINEHLDVCLKH